MPINIQYVAKAKQQENPYLHTKTVYLIVNRFVDFAHSNMAVAPSAIYCIYNNNNQQFHFDSLPLVYNASLFITIHIHNQFLEIEVNLFILYGTGWFFLLMLFAVFQTFSFFPFELVWLLCYRITSKPKKPSKKEKSGESKLTFRWIYTAAINLFLL